MSSLALDADFLDPKEQLNRFFAQSGRKTPLASGLLQLAGALPSRLTAPPCEGGVGRASEGSGATTRGCRGGQGGQEGDTGILLTELSREESPAIDEEEGEDGTDPTAMKRSAVIQDEATTTPYAPLPTGEGDATTTTAARPKVGQFGECQPHRGE
jgi:hypothetical protein